MTNTNEALDLLDRLSNPDNVRQAGLLRDRPMDRFPAAHFKANILGKGADLQVEQRTPANSQYPQTGVWLDLDVTEVISGKAELGEQRLWVRAPGPRQTGEHNADDNSELGQMMLAAASADGSVKSLRALPGRKNVEFKEDVHAYMSRQRNDQTGAWGDVERKTFYYKLTFGASSNGATAPSATPSEEAVEKAISLLIGDGMTIVEFARACSKDPVINKDKALISLLSSKMDSFIADQVGKGRILRDRENIVAI